MPERPVPTVSVCMLAYQHGPFIGAAIRSALEQEGPPLEVVVADDGSTDGTYEEVQSVRDADGTGRVVLLPRRPNGGLAGIAENGNRALRACRGKYVAFLDGDDMFLPGKVAKQVAWLEADARRVLCGHDVEVFDSASGARMYLGSEMTPLRRGVGAAPLVRDGVPFATAATMVRRDALPVHLFESRLRIVLDWLLWIEALAAGGEWGYVDGVLARYRRHGGNITSRNPAVSAEDQLVTLALVESRFPALVRDVGVGRGRVLYGLGIGAAQRGDAGTARRYWREAMAHGWPVKSALRLAASYAGHLPAQAR
jgi:glycosyltransferase involved in cell wall biosynthesis